MKVGAEARAAALREITEFGELQVALEDRDAAQEELRKCQQDAIQLQDRLAAAEALLREATTLLFDWDALVGGTGSHATETRDFLARVGYDPMTATLRKTDSASDCAHEWVNASNFEPGPNERCMKCNAIRRIAEGHNT